MAGNIEEILNHLGRYYPTEKILLDYLIDDPKQFAQVAEGEDRAVHHLTSLGLVSEDNREFMPSALLELQ